MSEEENFWDKAREELLGNEKLASLMPRDLQEAVGDLRNVKLFRGEMNFVKMTELLEEMEGRAGASDGCRKGAEELLSMRDVEDAARSTYREISLYKIITNTHWALHRKSVLRKTGNDVELYRDLLQEVEVVPLEEASRGDWLGLLLIDKLSEFKLEGNKKNLKTAFDATVVNEDESKRSMEPLAEASLKKFALIIKKMKEGLKNLLGDKYDEKNADDKLFKPVGLILNALEARSENVLKDMEKDLQGRIDELLQGNMNQFMHCAERVNLGESFSHVSKKAGEIEEVNVAKENSPKIFLASNLPQVEEKTADRVRLTGD